MWSRIQPVGRHLTSHRVLGITAAAATITAITYHTTSQTPISTAATTTTTSPSTSTSRKPTSVIIGAGIVGLTTAYELAKSGHHVIVIDERSGPALASSYKNGSLICPSLLQPWANQGVMKKFVKSLWDDQPAMKLRFASIIDPSFWRWSYHFLSNCNSKRQHINAQALLSLSSFSAKCMKEMMADTHINFHMTSHGSLQLAPNVEALSALSASAIPIQKQGLSCDILSTSQHVHTLEPAISTSTNPLAGGVFSSMDTSGDMRTCALGLQEICQLRYASEFIYNDGMSHFITSTSTSTSTSSTTTTSHGMQLRSGRQIYADHIIITVGNWTTKMISQLGKYVPVYPVKGYVVEVPLLPNHPGPHVNLVDDANKLYIAPLHHPHQHLIRISGMAEFAGWQNIGTVVDIKRPQYLLHQTISWLPNQLDVKNASFYSCSRPVSPDDLPYIGHVTSNIYINTGHGSKGWTLCFGSARLLAEMITSKNTSIDMKPYDPLRFN